MEKTLKISCVHVIYALTQMGFVRDLIYLIASKYFELCIPLVACDMELATLIVDHQIHAFVTMPVHTYAPSTAAGAIAGTIAGNQIVRNVTSIVSGWRFTIITTPDGYHARGANSFGQLGLGDWVMRQPFTFRAMPGIVAIAAGMNHVVVLRRISDGPETGPRGACAVYGWGRHNGNCLGLNPWAASPDDAPPGISTAMRINIDNPDAVACGLNYSLILAAGEVYFCGLPEGHQTAGSFRHSPTRRNIESFGCIQKTLDTRQYPPISGLPQAAPRKLGHATEIFAFDARFALGRDGSYDIYDYVRLNEMSPLAYELRYANAANMWVGEHSDDDGCARNTGGIGGIDTEDNINEGKPHRVILASREWFHANSSKVERIAHSLHECGACAMLSWVDHTCGKILRVAGCWATKLFVVLTTRGLYLLNGYAGENIVKLMSIEW